MCKYKPSAKYTNCTDQFLQTWDWPKNNKIYVFTSFILSAIVFYLQYVKNITFARQRKSRGFVRPLVDYDNTSRDLVHLTDMCNM